MKKALTILFLLPLLAKSQTGSFTFTVASAVRTSAGVYKKDSTLVRTLWADKNYAAGTYTEYWDGKDDYGNNISSPDATYNVKVLSNNVGYTWDGIIGNTSSSNTGTGVHRGYYTSMTGMAIAGNTAYFCQGYSELYASEAKFSTTNPQVRLDIFPGSVSTMNADYVATDGINVYWAGYDAYIAENSFVHATKVSDDSQVSFGAYGTAYTMVRVGAPKKYTSVIDKIVLAKSRPSGLAVQKSGNFLFVSHSGLNEIHVFNKTSGQLLQKISITNPQSVSVDGSSLWIASGTNTVAKYTINSNGSLGTKTLALLGIATPGAIQVFGTTIAVIDAGSNQVVRFFNTSTGTQAAQLGVTGGYASSPVVTSTKFFFNDYRGNLNSFIAWQPDGSFWVGDPGNFRELHFDASKKYIGNIMSMGATYSTNADRNNINRVFAEYLEFAIDYTKPLTGSTGWSLVKNWGYKTTTGYDRTKKLQNVITLSNGRTYATIYSAASVPQLVELTSTGLRFSGINPFGTYGVICQDGGLQKTSGTDAMGGSTIVTKYPLTGFDATGNPIWSKTGTLLAKTPTNNLKDPNISPPTEVLTASKKVIFYEPFLTYHGNASLPYNGYHLGAIKQGGNTWLWKTQKSTFTNYKGTFPEADYFEIGNGVNQHAGSRVNVIDNNIITGFNGENWKNMQTNYYNHYYEDGLAVGQFGADRYTNAGTAAAGNAGNALTPAVVKDASGNLYLYHGDESQHGGIHRWKITNLSSIKEQYASIAYPKSYLAPAAGYINLHSGLPLNVKPTTAGWTTSGVATSITGTKKYILDGAPDIFTNFVQLTGTASVQKDLGTNNVSASWKISGQVSFEFSDVVVGSGINTYIDVLDAAGKILARFYYSGSAATKVVTIYGNSAKIASATGLSPTLLQFQPLEISILNGLVTIKYANFPAVTTPIYDATASWQKPKTLRQYFVGGYPAYAKYIGFMDMLFYKDYSLASSTQPLYVTK
ncbi:MAG: hypothetical protein ABI691_12155 [Ginsengibacter sp.]